MFVMEIYCIIVEGWINLVVCACYVDRLFECLGLINLINNVCVNCKLYFVCQGWIILIIMLVGVAGCAFVKAE